MESELFVKYKSTYTRAFADLSLHLFILIGNYYAMYLLRRHWLCSIPLFISGFMIGRTFIVYHHCGHDNYTPSTFLNFLIGISFGILVSCPFSWNISHHKHHLTSGNATNNSEHPFNETVFHTFEQ